MIMPPRYKKGLDWEDDHTYYLNKLYSLYSKAISWPDQIRDIGYEGFPDPRFESPNGEPLTPDFLSINSKEDAINDIQIIDVKGFENVGDHFGDKEDAENHVKQTIEELEKYVRITDDMVTAYLSKLDLKYNPGIQEVVVLIPEGMYRKYETKINAAVENKGLILWIIEQNSEEYVWKRKGKHENPNLNRKLEGGSGSGGVRTYPGRDDLIRFTRDTDTDLRKYHFTHTLMTFCARNGSREFHFDDVDEIFTIERSPPMFGHLAREEREEIWRSCLYTLIERFGLLEQVPGKKNTYRWTKSGFLNQARYRSNIIDEVGKELGVIEEQK